MNFRDPFKPKLFHDSLVTDGPTQISTLCDIVELWVIAVEHF